MVLERNLDTMGKCRSVARGATTVRGPSEEKDA